MIQTARCSPSSSVKSMAVDHLVTARSRHSTKLKFWINSFQTLNHPAMVDASTSRPPKTGGDDLDDDLDLDEGLLALSEPEDGEDGVILEHEAHDQEGGRVPTERKSAKRPLEDDLESSALKRKRRREKDKLRRAKVRPHLFAKLVAKSQKNGASHLESATTPSHLHPPELSDLLLASLRAARPTASQLELDELVVPESSFLPPIDTPDSGLIARVEAYVGERRIKAGYPAVVILCLSGVRCADVVREVREVKGKGEVGKVSPMAASTEETRAEMEALRQAFEV